MIVIHKPTQVIGPIGESLDRHVLPPGEPIPHDALWIDLIEPTKEEDRLVETYLNIEIPTKEEMADIEPSEILYNENNARYMTARVLCSSDTENPNNPGLPMLSLAMARPSASSSAARRASSPRIS